MSPKMRQRNVHCARDVTPAGRNVMRDLFSEEEAIELEIRSTLLRGLERWLERSDMTRVEAAEVLGVTRGRVSDLRRGNVSRFSVALLVRLAVRAGLEPTIGLAAQSRTRSIHATQSDR